MRKPVKRQGAERYLFITLLSFAFSVTLTRLFLELTGYPQLGGGELHIAHVLWGGLLLFIASLIPLMVANRWGYTLSALLAGAGVGLFIDEVGKFITSSNDYFYPLAAPIIYAFFLLVVLLYLRVRRPPTRSARAELYRALDAFEEVLEYDLDPQERADLEDRLRAIAKQADQPHLAGLANTLLEYLPSLTLVKDQPTLLERFIGRWKEFEARWITPERLKAVLAGGLIALGVSALWRMVSTLPISPTTALLEQNLATLVYSGQVRSNTGLVWFLARIGLETSVGALLLYAAYLLTTNREKLAISYGYASLLLSLTTVNLLVFYFDQFSTILTAAIQFSLLLGLNYYRRRYITR